MMQTTEALRKMWRKDVDVYGQSLSRSKAMMLLEDFAELEVAAATADQLLERFANAGSNCASAYMCSETEEKICPLDGLEGCLVAHARVYLDGGDPLAESKTMVIT